MKTYAFTTYRDKLWTVFFFRQHCPPYPRQGRRKFNSVLLQSVFFVSLHDFAVLLSALLSAYAQHSHQNEIERERQRTKQSKMLWTKSHNLLMSMCFWLLATALRLNPRGVLAYKKYFYVSAQTPITNDCDGDDEKKIWYIQEKWQRPEIVRSVCKPIHFRVSCIDDRKVSNASVRSIQ